MSSLEKKLSTIRFWLLIAGINQTVILAVIAFGCVYSGFTCQGTSMKSVMSIYAFTLFTPQIALGVISLIGLLYTFNSFSELRENWRYVLFFLMTLLLLVLFVYFN